MVLTGWSRCFITFHWTDRGFHTTYVLNFSGHCWPYTSYGPCWPSLRDARPRCLFSQHPEVSDQRLRFFCLTKPFFVNCSNHIVRIFVFSVPMDKPDFPMVQRTRSFLIPLQFCVYHLPLFDGTHNLNFANMFDLPSLVLFGVFP